MAKKLIELKFWKKILLATGHHSVEISCIESGNNFTTGTPFIICIFENENGYFPQKINLKLSSEQNRKLIGNLFKSVGLDEPTKEIDYSKLLNKKLTIYIDGSFTTEFGKGVNLNSFTKFREENESETSKKQIE